MKGVDLVAINGELLAPEDAKISVFDRGFLFGDAVYEVTRSYGNILFQLEAHIQRLFKSAGMIDMDLEISPEDLIKEMYRVLKASGKPNRYIRVQVTRGAGPIGMGMNLAVQRNWVIIVKDVDLVVPELYKNGAHIVTTDRLRNTKRALDPNIKSGNYLNNVLAFKAAAARGAAECVMVDQHGLLTEGTTSNVFAVIKGVLRTPPVGSDILEGITRRLVLEEARRLKIPVEETSFTPLELEVADEVFITSSTREILPISKVNDRAISCVGPLTSQLREAYGQVIQTYLNWAQDQHPWK